jgi:hypothetical protein
MSVRTRLLTVSLCLTFAPALGAPVNPAAVMTCLDSPMIASGSAYGACKKAGSGPKYASDVVRTNDPKNPGGQSWVTWSTLTPDRSVCQLQTTGSCVWTNKGSIPTLNPPAAPVTPPVVVASTQSVVLTWTAPTQNVDNSPLTNLAGFNVYQGATKVATLTGLILTYTITGLAPGAYTFAVTAVTTTGVESASATIGKTITAPPVATTPKSVSGLTATVIPDPKKT